MSITVWDKYLPIIRIVLKKSLTADQQLALNAPDFERAGFRRKQGYKFLVELKDRRLSNVLVDSPIASSLATTLLSDQVINELTSGNEFHISMNAKYQLTIKHVPPVEA
jgi:hypothetical protein